MNSQKIDIQIGIMDSFALNKQLEVANFVSELSKDAVSAQNKLIPVGIDDVLQKYIGLAAMDGGQPVGYMGANAPREYKDQLQSKVGTLLVAPDHQGAGVAKKLIHHMTSLLNVEGVTPYAYCNDESIVLFRSLGYEVVDLPTILPRDDVSPYGNTPMIYW